MKVATNREETRPKVRLYHGSNVEVKKPSLRMCRKKKENRFWTRLLYHNSEGTG